MEPKTTHTAGSIRTIVDFTDKEAIEALSDYLKKQGYSLSSGKRFIWRNQRDGAFLTFVIDLKDEEAAVEDLIRKDEK